MFKKKKQQKNPEILTKILKIVKFWEIIKQNLKNLNI